MSVLGTVTGSLPNLLNYIQGKWSVEYRNKVPLSEKDRESAMNNIKKTDPTDAISLLVSFNDAMALMESGWKELEFDSFVEMNEIDDTTITSHPVEGGTFRSVNKVRKPRIVKVTLAKGGIQSGIEDSLSEVKDLVAKARYGAEKVRNTAQLITDIVNSVSSYLEGKSSVIDVRPKIISIPMEFRVITPFETIEKLNLIKLDYTFKQDTGRNSLFMYLTFQEIIERGVTSKKTTKTPKNPTNESKQNVGTVSAQLPSDTSYITKAITG